MTASSPRTASWKRYGHRWLLLIPFIWQIGCAPFVNTASVRVFSLPLPLVWQMAGILIASALIALVFMLDERMERALGLDEDSADRAADAEASS